MLEIPTARGLAILADDEYENVLARYSWFVVKTTGGRFYAQARIPGLGRGAPRIAMHRMIMDPPRGMVVHHINNNGLDNRRANLVVVTQGRNTAEAQRDHGRLGVHRIASRYRAQIRLGKRRLSLGMFATAEEALAAVNAARVEHGFYPPLPHQVNVGE